MEKAWSPDQWSERTEEDKAMTLSSFSPVLNTVWISVKMEADPQQSLSRIYLV